MELEKKSLVINQIIAQKLDTQICDGDCIVPDIKPDILNVIETNGIVNIYKKEVMDGKVRIDGAINTYTIYLAEEEKREIRAINYVLDFSQSINIDNVQSDMTAEINTSLKSIEAKIVNERKINIKAVLEFDIKVFSNNTEEFITGISDISDLQKMDKNVLMNSLLGSGRTKAGAKETIKIDEVDNLAEILKVDVQIINRDTKASYNKILVKADCKLKIMYLTDDERINEATATIPVMGFIDIADVSEENSFDVNYEIKNMVIKPNAASEHSIYVEIEIEMSAAVYEEKEISIMEDLYSPSKNLCFDKKSVKIMHSKKSYHDTFSIREKQALNIGEEKVYDADVKVIIDNFRILNNEIEINGNVNINFIHSSNLMQITEINLPLQYIMKCQEIDVNTNVKIETDIPLQDFTILPGGEVEIKVDIEFFVNTSSELEINKIENITEQNNENTADYNMVIYFTKKGDSLWKIAKEFKSTVESIKSSNELTSDEIMPGKQLFITKYAGVNG